MFKVDHRPSKIKQIPSSKLQISTTHNLQHSTDEQKNRQTDELMD